MSVAAMLLAEYLFSVGMTKYKVLGITWSLSESAAKEMLKYIIETREEDSAKLYEMSLEIAKKHHIIID